MLFDTYDNDNMRDNPIALLINNVKGETTQWDNDHDFMSQASVRCLFDHRNSASGDPVVMILTYKDKKLTLRLRSYLRAVDILCGEIHDLELTQNGFFGVTATTGHLVDNHDLVSFVVRTVGDSVGDPQIPLHFDHQHEEEEKKYWNEGDNKQ